MISDSQLKLGLIDFGYREDKDSLSILGEVMEFCANAEQLGFSRFWLAEHHYVHRTLPWTNPDILVGTLSGMTEKIRIGAAGVLLPFYSAYSVATNYKFMNNVFGDRIDLGLAKTLIDSEYVMKSIDPTLNDGNLSAKFDEKMYQLSDFYNNEHKNYIDNKVVIPPYGGLTPSIWYLSNSYRSCYKAVECGFNYCRSIFHGTYGKEVNPDKNKLEDYKLKYEEKNGTQPEVAVAIALFLDSTVEKAEANLKKQNEAEDTGTPWWIIPTSINKLQDLLYDYQQRFGVNEFIIYNVSSDSVKINENISEISELFKLI